MAGTVVSWSQCWVSFPSAALVSQSFVPYFLLFCLLSRTTLTLTFPCVPRLLQDFGVHDFLTDSLDPPHQRKEGKQTLGNLLLRYFIAQTAALLAGYSSYPFDTVRRAKQLIPHRTYSDICRQLLSLVRRGVYDSDRVIAIIAAAAALWPGWVFAWKTGRFGGFRFRHFWLGLHAGLLGVGLARLGFFTGTGFFAGCQQNSQRMVGSAIVLVLYGEVRKSLG